MKRQQKKEIELTTTVTDAKRWATMCDKAEHHYQKCPKKWAQKWKKDLAVPHETKKPVYELAAAQKLTEGGKQIRALSFTCAYARHPNFPFLLTLFCLHNVRIRSPRQ
jgi:hypothetical protein